MPSRAAMSRFTKESRPQRLCSRRMWRLRLMEMRKTCDSFRNRSMTAVDNASDDKKMVFAGQAFSSISPTTMQRKYSCVPAARLANAFMVELFCISSSIMSQADWCLAMALTNSRFDTSVSTRTLASEKSLMRSAKLSLSAVLPKATQISGVELNGVIQRDSHLAEITRHRQKRLQIPTKTVFKTNPQASATPLFSGRTSRD